MKRKIYLITIFFGLALLLSGCGQDQYALEKRFWQLQKKAEKIFKNPAGSPPKELNKTVALLNNFIKKNPQNILALDAEFSIARLYIVKEQYVPARRYLQTLLEKYKKSQGMSAEIRFLIGNSYELEGNWDLALGEYKRITNELPSAVKSMQIPVYIAMHYRIKHQPDKMVAAFQEAVSYYKNLAANHPASNLAYNAEVMVTQCYLELKEWQNAANNLSSMIANFPKDATPDIYLQLAMLYKEKLANKQKAIETLQALAKRFPRQNIIKATQAIIKELEK